MENQTPNQLGYSMPPEWHNHEATWLSWPHKEASWPGKFEPVPYVFAEIVRFIAPHEEVRINVTGEEMEQNIRAILNEVGIVKEHLDHVKYFHFGTNDAWCRDHGPMFILNEQKKKAVVDWKYNAWGGKYLPCDLDDVIPKKIADHYGLYCYEPNMILEGGSIDVNGAGVLLTTTSCLLNPNRNPSLSKEEIETYIKSYLGVKKILWLGDGIVGDDTDGHIDDIARFINPNTLVMAVEKDTKDENYEPLKENLELAKTFTDQDGKPFRIVELPMPEPFYYDGERLPASYANFYIANNVVLVPTFGSKQDEAALEILQREFGSKRRVQGIDCQDLIWGLGALHCVTHEEPSTKS